MSILTFSAGQGSTIHPSIIQVCQYKYLGVHTDSALEPMCAPASGWNVDAAVAGLPNVFSISCCVL